MDIIIITLPKSLIPLIRFINILFNKKIFFLKIQGFDENIKSDLIKIEKFVDWGIIPLPIDEIREYNDFSNYLADYYFDYRKKVFNKTRVMAPIKFIGHFSSFFQNIDNIERKIQIILHSIIAGFNINDSVKVNIWASAHPERNILIIDFNYHVIFWPKSPPNVNRIIIPYLLIINCIAKVLGYIYRIIRSLKPSNLFKGKRTNQTQNVENKKNQRPRIAFITHQGLEYGSLYDKNLYYSDFLHSELNKENLLHIDYSGIQKPSENLQWTCMGKHNRSIINYILYSLIVISKGILYIRNLDQLFGILLIAKVNILYRSYLRKLRNYPALKIALIDYEALCPRELLLALENQSIVTIATQERFLGAFSYSYDSVILDYYLCASHFSENSMRGSPIHSVNTYYPVGQWRSDYFFLAKESSPPQEIQAPIIKKRQIITALGYHTYLNWHESHVDPVLNWKAHKHFLDDMCLLAEDLPNVFIILRYKNIDWLKLPFFAEIVEKICFSENIMISTDYSKKNLSYHLCSHSNLVIAKFSSLADECLSVGIPVLFHDYSHNCHRIIADAFDYNQTRIMCHNYEELLERARIVLSGTPNEMTEDYEYLRTVVYGNLGDGKVRERVHAFIEGLLSEEGNSKMKKI